LSKQLIKENYTGKYIHVNIEEVDVLF
jgi:hypothetical protein